MAGFLGLTEIQNPELRIFKADLASKQGPVQMHRSEHARCGQDCKAVEPNWVKVDRAIKSRTVEIRVLSKLGPLILCVYIVSTNEIGIPTKTLRLRNNRPVTRLPLKLAVPQNLTPGN